MTDCPLEAWEFLESHNKLPGLQMESMYGLKPGQSFKDLKASLPENLIKESSEFKNAPPKKAGTTHLAAHSHPYFLKKEKERSWRASWRIPSLPANWCKGSAGRASPSSNSGHQLPKAGSLLWGSHQIVNELQVGVYKEDDVKHRRKWLKR